MPMDVIHDIARFGDIVVVVGRNEALVGDTPYMALQWALRNGIVGFGRVNQMAGQASLPLHHFVIAVGQKFIPESLKK